MSYTYFAFFLKVPRQSKPVLRHRVQNTSLIDDNGGSNSVYNYRAFMKNEKNPLYFAKPGPQANYLPTVEIWSKAAIGFYLWEHILNGRFTRRHQYYQYGFKNFPQMKVKFRTGPSLTPQSLESFLSKSLDDFARNHYQLTNLILVLNGRSQEKIDFAKLYLDRLKKLHESEYKDTFNAGVVLLGHEFCFNRWIKPYLASAGGPLKFLFVVYDWKDIDDEEIYQWPLGVATYRGFPNFDAARLNLHLSRPYSCNFLGTAYSNSSRQELLRVLDATENLICYVKVRKDWEPQESKDSLDTYLQALRLSDLTLSPIGMNHECYRIYEALAFGSALIVEENLNHIKGKKSNCDQKNVYRLLKRYNAPFKYIKNWTQELPTILKQELNLSPEEKASRRINHVRWYSDFKLKLQEQFLKVISIKFHL